MKLNVTEEHYQMVGATLLETFSEFMGGKWTSELHDAWAGAYGAIVEGMTA